MLLRKFPIFANLPHGYRYDSILHVTHLVVGKEIHFCVVQRYTRVSHEAAHSSVTALCMAAGLVQARSRGLALQRVPSQVSLQRGTQRAGYASACSWGARGTARLKAWPGGEGFMSQKVSAYSKLVFNDICPPGAEHPAPLLPTTAPFPGTGERLDGGELALTLEPSFFFPLLPCEC